METKEREHIEGESVTGRPFRIRSDGKGPIRRALMGLVRPAVEKTLAFRRLNEIYAEIMSADEPGRHFSERALEALGITIDVSEADLKRVPKDGAVIAVANHPFGGLEGVILTALLGRVRPDVKLLANYMLRLIPELRDSLIFIDPFGRAGAAGRNLSGVRAAVRWAKEGHLLGVFPAGEVSHLTLRKGCVVDPVWHETAARIVQHSNAAVLPIYFEGRNSKLFQVLGLIHPSLRTVMLPRELLKKQRTTIRMHIGEVVPAAKLEQFSDPEELTNYMRVQTYLLGGLAPSQATIGQPTPRPEVQEDLADPQDAEAMAAEVDALGPECLLLASSGFDVYCARAEQIPSILNEIGMLRELTFRGVGEGTGKGCDLDEFDEHYFHLFVWNRQTSEMVGAYRLGATDEILPAHGIEGLYTSTLFDYKRRLLEQIDPALELGRSFVRPTYQRHHAPLGLLWRGIAAFVTKYPRYARLFGPVSISNDYQSLSKQLLIAFLNQNYKEVDLSKLVKAKSPPKLGRIRSWSPKATSVAVRDVKEVGELITRIEADKAVPVLLRQYLRLNAHFLAFNVDAEFGDVIDGLMYLDLSQLDRNILDRYMGKAEAAEFRTFHGLS